jgi:hypothetical protein
MGVSRPSRLVESTDSEAGYFKSTMNFMFTFIDQRRAPDVPSATHTDLMFGSSMSDEDFFKWLRVKGVNEKDCKTLSGKI